MKKVIIIILLLCKQALDCSTNWRTEIDRQKLAVPFVSVQVHLINEYNQLLLGRLHTCCWSVPFGTIKPEDPNLDHTVERIVYEHTGIRVMSSFLQKSDNIVLTHHSGDRENLFRMLYVVKDFVGAARVGGFAGQYSMWQWCDKEKIPGLLHPFVMSQDQFQAFLESQEK